MSRAGWWRVSAAVVCVVLAAACSSEEQLDSGNADDESAESSGDVVLQPGEPIADGFLVADGTSVPGGAFPEAGGTFNGDPAPRAWSAVITSDLDLEDAVAAYAAQMVELGFRGYSGTPIADVASLAVRPCGTTLAQDTSDQPALTNQPEPGTPLLQSCELGGERVVDGSLQVVHLVAERSHPAMSSFPVDTIVLGSTTLPASRGTEPLYPDQPDQAGAEPDASTSGESVLGPPVSTFPAQVGDAVPPGCSSRVVIEPGSHFLGAAYDCFYRGFTLVLEVTGDPTEVFDAYVRQIDEAPGYNGSPEVDDVDDFDGRQVRTAQIWGDDSSSLRVTMLQGGDRPTVLQIAHQAG